MALDDDVREGQLLYALATEPAQALPPGKSLLSALTRPPPTPTPSRLEAQVSEMVHKAFWDEALVTLSSPIPAVQLPRLRLLYSDLHHTLVPLFPASHPLLFTLSQPISPTSSPLHSALAFLKDILLALRQRCAPVRDPDVDQILAPLLTTPPPHPSHPGSPNPLASLFVDTLKSLICLADVLKSDLAQSILGSMSDSQLADFIKDQAHTRARELILDLDGRMWGTVSPSHPREEVLRLRVEDLTRQWHDWISAEERSVAGQYTTSDWISRLLQALTSSVPVTCHPFDQSSNALPPQFFLSRSSLLYIQNYLQALVVSASLKSLLRLPINSDIASDFISRVWSLLKAEIDNEDHSMRGAQDPQGGGLEDGQTKLRNLADEVIRAARSLPNPPTGAEDELRAAVERTLRSTDPVFLLLQGRLRHAITGRLHMSAAKGVSIPDKLRTGRGGLSTEEPAHGRFKHAHQGVIRVKGFEDEILVREIMQVIGKLSISIEWIEGVLEDLRSTNVVYNPNGA